MSGAREGAAPFADLVSWVAGMPQRAVVAVDGPSGAGKTELVAHLRRGLGRSRQTVVVHLEDLYPGWDGLGAVVPLAAGVLAAWTRSPNAGALLPVWDWARDAPGPPRRLPDGDLLLLDGVASGALALQPWRRGLVWVEAPEPARRERALARDGETYWPHWERWARQEHEHFGRERTRERADWVLSSLPS